MTLTRAFSNTLIGLEKSMAEIDKMLGGHGVRESRHTHRRPERAPLRSDDLAPETIGALVYEFVYPGKVEGERRGVRISVNYQPEYTQYKTPKGTTAEMAARALFWFLKAKFDSIDYGIEAFSTWPSCRTSSPPLARPSRNSPRSLLRPYSAPSPSLCSRSLRRCDRDRPPPLAHPPNIGPRHGGA